MSPDEWLVRSRQHQPNFRLRAKEVEIDILAQDLYSFATWAVEEQHIQLPSGEYVISSFWQRSFEAQTATITLWRVS